MLKLRRGVVSGIDPLLVRVGDEDRPAWADRSLVGEMREGDEVIVNVEARDLGLGSGGFDLVHVNLTRGLDGPGAGEAAAMKLNYTSLQHPVDPVESLPAERDWATDSRPGSLAPRTARTGGVGGGTRYEWDAGRIHPDGGRRPAGGAVGGRGGAPPPRAALRSRHRRPAYGGQREAISVTGALAAAAGPLGWDAAIAGPGPGIVGSGKRAGARWDGRARDGALGSRAGIRDPDRAADVERRRCGSATGD